ncbi:hypothetical protein PIB30_060984 [Stylosanthes scabra]|uniref:Putative plant transposon protein domain-containing protein n=1 Tax=Stylosanthes scabra TaxID=79078 RepID=A0ABU6VJ30_9FABA|nr:hypothetical protein [Stylosanthes scabra]
MASSSAPVTVFDEHRFRKEFNQQLSESHVRRKKVIPKVGFNLDEGEYPQIMEQIMLSFVRGIKVDFSPDNIRRVMRFKSATTGAEMDYKTHQAIDQRLNEVLADLCIPGATWKLSSGQPAVPIQLRRTKLHPLATAWQEFIIHSLVPTRNKYEITIARAILIHSIMRGEEVSDSSRITKQGEPWLSKILEEKYITAKQMESSRIPRNLPQQQQGDDDEDIPMPQAGGSNDEEEEQQ